MGIENYDFERQKINYLVNQLLNEVIVQEFNEIPYNFINKQLTTYIFEPMPNNKTPMTEKVFFIREALISKDLFKENLFLLKNNTDPKKAPLVKTLFYLQNNQHRFLKK